MLSKRGDKVISFKTLKQNNNFIRYILVALIMLGIYLVEFLVKGIDYLILELLVIVGYIFIYRLRDKNKRYDIKLALMLLAMHVMAFMIATASGQVNMRRCCLLGFPLLIAYLVVIVNVKRSYKLLIVIGCLVALSGIANHVTKSTYYGSYKNESYIKYTPLEIVTMGYNKNYFVKNSSGAWTIFLEQFGSMDYFETDIVDSSGVTKAKLRYKWMTSDVYRYKIKFQIKDIGQDKWTDYGEFYTNYNVMNYIMPEVVIN